MKQSFTIKTGSDGTPPTIVSLYVNPTSAALGSTLNIAYTVSDSGGSGLNRAELYRAPDNGGVPGTWSGLRARSHSGNGPVSASLSDTPSIAGTYWYGLHVIDNAGNIRTESHPLGPVRISITTVCGSSEDIRARIQRRLQFLASSPPIEYLPGSSWQAALVSFNLQAYDEVYYSALDLRGLANSAFSRATRSLNGGDANTACTYVERGERYISLMVDTEATAVLVFNDRVTGISEIARTIASESCKADVTLLTWKWGPKASLAAEQVCLPVDYVLDRSLYGKDQALINLKQRLRTEVLSKVLIRTIPVPSLGGKTIYQYLSSGVTHDIGSSRLYSVLSEVINNPSTRQEIMKALAELGEKAVIDYGTERLACEYLAWFEDSIGIPTTNSQCSRFQQSNNATAAANPEVIETSPTRNGAYVSPSLSVITAKFTGAIVTGPKPVTVLNSNGTLVPISSKTVQNDILTLTLASALSLGSVYTVTLPVDSVRNLSNTPNQEYRWSFSTPPPPLSIGRTVVVANTGGVGLSLRSSPSLIADGTNIIATVPEGHRLQIVGGPVRADGYSWWNIRDNNFEGWSAIGDWLTPNDTAGLRLGAEVTVSNTTVGLDLRDAPSGTAPIIGSVVNGNKLILLSGPYYVDGYLWWSVSSAAGIGYVPIAYWLFPTSDGIAPVILTEAGTNRALALDSVTRLRGPFKVISNLNFSEDHHTRVMLFTSNLAITQSDIDLVTVKAAGISLKVENVGTFPSLMVPDTSYIVVRLPDGLPAGDLPLLITVRGLASTDSASLSISP
ncbi:MAG TPA: Ig-like domain-containing protein [Pyrinomonadaceae bacterium]|nr:Ig-like domain-containing protein [Pyrinomonadaceae bacterium]